MKNKPTTLTRTNNIVLEGSYADFNRRANRAGLVLAARAIEKIIREWKVSDIQKLRTSIEDSSPIIGRAEIWKRLYAAKRVENKDNQEFIKTIDIDLRYTHFLIERYLRDGNKRIMEKFPKDLDIKRIMRRELSTTYPL